MPRSIFSDHAESINEKAEEEGAPRTRFRWTSYWDFVLYAMVCSTGPQAFSIMASHPSLKYRGDVLQFMIAYVTFGLPILYMQVVLGQYTQIGIILFKHLAPIGHGLTYSYLLNMFMRSANRGIIISTFLVYLMTSVRVELQWLICPENRQVNCWEKSRNCTKNCLANANISAYVYYITKFMNEPAMNIEDIVLTLPPYQKILPLVFGWFMVLLCIIYSVSNHRRFMVVLMHLALALLFILLCGAILTRGGFYFFEEIPKLNGMSWLSMTAWWTSIEGATGLLGLGRGFHIVSGSYLPPTAPSGILSVVAVTLNFFVSFCCTVITFSCYGIVKFRTHSENKYIMNLPHDMDFVTLGIIPQALPFMGVAQFWSVVYFLFCIVIQTNNQVVHLMIIEQGLSDAYPKLAKYRKYVLSFLCLFSFLLGLVLIGNGMYAMRIIFIDSSFISASINIMTTAIIVSWIYGVQKLCDDIHYLCGNQPSKFWKICWYILPAVLICTLIAFYADTLANYDFRKICVFSLFVLLLTLPIPIYSTIETFRYIKRRNLLGLFRPTDLFGPPNFEDRRLRKIYNPRSEIRSRRRTDKCQHKCLLGNAYLKVLISEDNMADRSDVIEVALDSGRADTISGNVMNATQKQ